jgi:Tfp pilus assembly major pilin PilA
MTKKEEQVLLIFERKIFRRIYGPKYENVEWKSRTNRELEDMSKGENIVKGAKDNLVGSPGKNGGGEDAQRDLHARTGRDETKRTAQETVERSRKRSSSAGSEKMERVGDW